MKRFVTLAVAALVAFCAFSQASASEYDDYGIAAAEEDRSTTELDTDYITVNTKKVRVYATEEYEAGDVVKVVIGKKTYKKKAKAGASSVVVKIKKPKVGKKVKIYLYDASGKKVCEPYTSKVFLSKQAKKGYTMKQVKQTAYYEKPDYIMKKSGGFVFWMYFTGTTYGFRYGKLYAIK